MHTHLIEELLPDRRLSLLGGPSGAGKSRWLLQMLRDWQQGKPILGRVSRPVPWLYVAGDRPKISVDETLLAIGIDPTTIKIYASWDLVKERGTELGQIYEYAGKGGYKLLVIEGFARILAASLGYTKGNMTNAGLAAALRMHSAMMLQDGVTVLAVMESPKNKPDQQYTNPRQRISGFAAWGHHSETIIMVEPTDAADPGNPSRTLTICPHNSRPSMHPGGFGRDGRLEFDALPAPPPDTPRRRR